MSEITSPPQLQVVFDRRVFGYILQELRRYPNCEEGGKYIGYVEVGESAAVKESYLRATITDFLPGGPNAKRTAIEFRPDGEFQYSLFREAEKRDSSIEHVGSWHSHHCNGLQELSGGDIRGYFKTLDNHDYRPSVFVASLVKRIPRNIQDDQWIDHFLFVRDHPSFYKITDRVVIGDSPSRFGDITGHRVVQERFEHATTWWYETPHGSQILAEDRKSLAKIFATAPRGTRADGIITLQWGNEFKQMTVSYPTRPGDEDMVINVGSGGRKILVLKCKQSDRSVGYAAALKALESF